MRVRVKPTRNHYVVTRGCAIEPKGSMSLPRSHYIIVGLCLLLCVIFINFKIFKKIIKTQDDKSHDQQVAKLIWILRPFDEMTNSK